MATDIANRMTFDSRKNTVRIDRDSETLWITRKGSDYSWKNNHRQGGRGNIRELHDQIGYTEEEWEFFDTHI